MPVRIRLATNGAARNWIMVSSIRLSRSCPLDRLNQHRDVGVKELEIVARLGHSADRRRHDEHSAAGVRGNRVWCLGIEIWFDHDDLDVLGLHRVDDVKGVLRCWWDTG